MPVAGRASAAAGLAGIAAAGAAVWYFDPVRSNFFPACALYSLTGYACPGCGLTRGFHALFHGDVVTALDHNALIPLFALALVFIVLSLLSIAVRGKGLVGWSASPPILIGLLAVLLVFGVLRNLPYYPFTLLFP